MSERLWRFLDRGLEAGEHNPLVFIVILVLMVLLDPLYAALRVTEDACVILRRRWAK